MKIRLEEEYLSEIFDRVAQKNDIDVKYVKDIHDHFFRSMKNLMQTPMLPEIRISRFGTFRPSLASINKDIKLYIEQYHKGKMDYEEVCICVSSLWPIRQSLIKEKLKRIKNDRRFRNAKRRTADKVVGSAATRENEA